MGFTDLLELGGMCLVVAGVAVVSFAAALIVAGVLMVAYAFLRDVL